MTCESRGPGRAQTGIRVASSAAGCLLSALIVSGLGCTEARPLARQERCFDWREQVLPLVEQQCLSCHGPEVAEADYRVDDYRSVLAPDRDGLYRVIAGDSESAFLRKAGGEGGHPRASDAALAVFEEWVVRCELSYFDTDAVHPKGYIDPANQDFHGHDLARASWDFESCEQCHGTGDDPEGGDTGHSCLQCHPTGPTGCDVCHGQDGLGAPPRGVGGSVDSADIGVGAHRAHVQALGEISAEILCETCHVVPTDWRAPGHVFDDTGAIDPPPAEVVFSGLAAADLLGFEGRTGSPSWNRETATCQNIYCHGATLADPTAALVTPVWTAVGQGQAACGSCHGEPPGAGHPGRTACEICHGEVWAGQNGFADFTLHVDGILQGDGGCSGCHGFPPNPSNESYPGSGGAHGAHDTAGLVCSVCHGNNGTGSAHNEGNDTVMRSNVDLVFDETFSYPGGTTIANGETPMLELAGGTVSCRVGCHNPIVADSADLATRVTWDAGPAACTACHDKSGSTPPLNHALGQTPAEQRSGCETCHDRSSHTSGQLAFMDADSTDTFGVATTSDLCRGCHDGGSGTFFGGLTPTDVSAHWTTPSSHYGSGLVDCTDCHAHHGSAAGGMLVDREETGCLNCHDGSASATDIAAEFAKASHHPIVDSEQTTHAVECGDCHDPHGDTAVRSYRLDPDPTDARVPIALASDWCITCHDGDQASDRTDFIGTSHNLLGSCHGSCHNIHGSDWPSITTAFEEELCDNCHAIEFAEVMPGNAGRHRVVDSDQTSIQPLECVTCHEPHRVTTYPWRPVTDPRTGELLPAQGAPRDGITNPDAASEDSGSFCLLCHDGSWPGAADAKSALAGETSSETGFIIKDDKSGHEKHADEPNSRNGQTACSYCHDGHGTDGTDPAGNVVRGKLLRDWMKVNQFPYFGKGTCGTPDPNGSCH